MQYRVKYGVGFTVEASSEKEALQETHKLVKLCIKNKEELVKTFKVFLRGDVKPDIERVE